MLKYLVHIFMFFFWGGAKYAVHCQMASWGQTRYMVNVGYSIFSGMNKTVDELTTCPRINRILLPLGLGLMKCTHCTRQMISGGFYRPKLGVLLVLHVY